MVDISDDMMESVLSPLTQHPLSSVELDRLNAEAWYFQYGNPVHARVLAETAVEHARAVEDAYREAYGRLSLASYQMRHGDRVLAEREFHALKTFFEDYGDACGEMRASFGISVLLERAGKAEESYAELIAYLRVLDDAELVDVVMVYNLLGVASVGAGMIDGAMRHYYHALRAARQLDSPDHLALVLSNLGDAQHSAGNYEDAISFLIEADTMVARSCMGAMAPIVAGNLAMCQLAMGAHEAAYETIDPYLEISDQVKWTGRANNAFFQVIAAHTYVAHSDWQRARAKVNKALNAAEASGEIKILTHCYWVLGLVERGCGHLDAALAALCEAESRLSKVRDPYYQVQIPHELARTYAALGQWREAYVYMERFQQHFQLIQGSAARARTQMMQLQSELTEAERDRDSALVKQAEAERARTNLEMLNRELAAKVVEIERLQEQLREQAIRDPLTELYNRRYLQQTLVSELQLAERRNYPCCVVLIDLDHFKEVNDRYGHPMGDRVLIALASLLGANIRGSDFACRFGGEEFCLVLADIGFEMAVARAEAFLEAFQSVSIELQDQQLSGVTFSAGVAEFPRHGRAVDQLLMAADEALYRAKAAGRRRVMVAD
ncbi:diguanylate cyclase [Chitinimonas sp. PSY-7]|uniref:diguanylate cyclase n=1 Tax=Chitinimonas sp. PSY-7 TaxID=3459088 RepID=UPI0040400EEF